MTAVTEPIDFIPVTSKNQNPAVYTESVTSNGVKLVSRQRDTVASSMKFAIRGGSAAEQYEEKGAAHLWASVAFAGTGKQSGLRLMRNLENNGVTVRASAQRERIVLSSSSDVSVADFAVSSIAESILSAPRDNYVITENLRIAEHDRQQLASSPRMQITEMLHEAAYGEWSALGSSVFSDEYVNVNAARNYRSRLFTPENLVIVSDGGVSHDELKSFAAAHFPAADGLVTPSASAIAAKPADLSYRGGFLSQRSRLPNGSAIAAVAFPLPAGAKSRAAAVVSRMLTNALKNNKAAGAFTSPYSKQGLVGVYATGSQESIKAVISSVAAELKSIAAKADSAEAANTLSLENFLAFENSGAVDMILTAQTLGLSTAEYLDVRNVTSADVSAAAKDMLTAKVTYTVLGNTYGAMSYEDVANAFKL